VSSAGATLRAVVPAQQRSRVAPGRPTRFRGSLRPSGSARRAKGNQARSHLSEVEPRWLDRHGPPIDGAAVRPPLCHRFARRAPDPSEPERPYTPPGPVARRTNPDESPRRLRPLGPSRRTHPNEPETSTARRRSHRKQAKRTRGSADHLAMARRTKNRTNPVLQSCRMEVAPTPCTGRARGCPSQPFWP
jgi:hypothetical protein